MMDAVDDHYRHALDHLHAAEDSVEGSDDESVHLTYSRLYAQLAIAADVVHRRQLDWLFIGHEDLVSAGLNR